MENNNKQLLEEKNKGKKKKRVSEVITSNEIKGWKNNIITIKAGTGAGKSYFIKNILYAFAEKENKKILILLHRTNCVNQFQKEVENDRKTNTIHIKTYQSLETLYYKHDNVFDFSNYEYIVCDEFHYFMSDAAFNKFTDISLNLILKQNATRIFMSATGNYMKNYICNVKKINTIDYEFPITFDFIKSLTFFNKDETLEKFIEEAIENQDKAIFFIQSAQKAYQLCEKYKKNCLFNCSKSNQEYYKYVDNKKISDMLNKEKFEELILITTTCLDAGVNINDLEVKHIVCYVEDIGSLIQCIGRKRIQKDDDKINLYIKTITNQQLGGKVTQLKKKVGMADFLKKHTVEEYIKKYARENDNANIVYDETVDEQDKGTKKINELMYFKCRLDIADMQIMLKYGKFGYCKYLANHLDRLDDSGIYHYRLIDEEYEKENLEKYLESLVGKSLYKEEQKELIDKINVRRNGKLLKGTETLTSVLKEENIMYEIRTGETDWTRKLDDGTKNPYYGKTHWMVYKLVC